jgi:hypothetical protein
MKKIGRKEAWFAAIFTQILIYSAILLFLFRYDIYDYLGLK